MSQNEMDAEDCHQLDNEAQISRDGFDEYRCTKNVIGVDPLEQNGSYIRAESAMMAAKKYLEKFPEDRECTVQLWKDSEHRRVLAVQIVQIFRI